LFHRRWQKLSSSGRLRFALVIAWLFVNCWHCGGFRNRRVKLAVHAWEEVQQQGWLRGSFGMRRS
jgi:hypothetical protein